MQYLNKFHRNGVKASARAGVPAGLYVALGDLRFQYLAMAFLETAWTCPPSGIDKKECVWVSASEVTCMCKAEGVLLQRLQVAEHLLADARAYADAFFASAQQGGFELGDFKGGASSNQAVMLFTQLDVWVGRYLLSKQGDNATVFQSLRGVAEHWVKQFCDAVPRARPEAFLAASSTAGVTRDLVNDEEAAPNAKAKSKAKAQAKSKAKAQAHGVELGPVRDQLQRRSHLC